MSLVALSGVETALSQTNTNGAAAATNSAASASSTNLTHLPEVVMQGRQDSLLGVAGSASEGTTGAAAAIRIQGTCHYT